MPFEQDVAYGDEVGEAYGKYHSTFVSPSGQIIAQIFVQNGWLVAHVTFPPDVVPEDVIDPYWNELNRYANEQGFGDKFRVIYSN